MMSQAVSRKGARGAGTEADQHPEGRATEGRADGLRRGELKGLVASTLERRPVFLDAARRFGTPLYLVDRRILFAQAARFTAAFSRPGQVTRAHYAFKANPSLAVVRTVKEAGLSADASSGIELDLALRLGFEAIVLSGPAKTDAELSLALDHADRVTIHMDSFGELDRLEALCARRGRKVRAGVRVNTQAHGSWTKFGIPMAMLPDFVAAAAGRTHVDLQGIQFHLSWNRNARAYRQTLSEVGPRMRAAAPEGGWRFLDIGGGYYPQDDEAVYPWLTKDARLQALRDGASAEGPPADWDLTYLLHEVEPIEAMAAEVLEAYHECVAPPGALDLWLEPGRYIANPGVHLLLQVADVKGDALAITDGGTNLLGWERIESEHTPLINLTQPAESQVRFNVFGSLCTPHDLWGYACYGRGLSVGDILILPAQGSYVQTLSQRFIKPVCQTVVLEQDGSMGRVRDAETTEDRYPELASLPGPTPRGSGRAGERG